MGARPRWPAKAFSGCCRSALFFDQVDQPDVLLFHELDWLSQLLTPDFADERACGGVSVGRHLGELAEVSWAQAEVRTVGIDELAELSEQPGLVLDLSEHTCQLFGGALLGVQAVSDQ